MTKHITYTHALNQMDFPGKPSRRSRRRGWRSSTLCLPLRLPGDLGDDAEDHLSLYDFKVMMAMITILMVLIAATLKKMTQVSLSGWWGEPAEPEKGGTGRTLMIRQTKTCIITTLMTIMAMTLLIIRD